MRMGLICEELDEFLSYLIVMLVIHSFERAYVCSAATVKIKLIHRLAE